MKELSAYDLIVISNYYLKGFYQEFINKENENKQVYLKTKQSNRETRAYEHFSKYLAERGVSLLD